MCLHPSLQNLEINSDAPTENALARQEFLVKTRPIAMSHVRLANSDRRMDGPTDRRTDQQSGYFRIYTTKVMYSGVDHPGRGQSLFIQKQGDGKVILKGVGKPNYGP